MAAVHSTGHSVLKQIKKLIDVHKSGWLDNFPEFGCITKC